MRTRNLAARAGRWSAEHRRAAILGWIGFVLVCVFAGQAAGLVKLSDEARQNGDAGAAARAIAHAGLKDRANEQVLIESRSALTAPDPQFRAGVLDVERRVSADPNVIELTSPYKEGTSQISPDGRAALVLFQIKGSKTQAKDRVGSVLARVAAAQRAHRQLRIEEVGDASADKALTKAYKDDFRKAERLSLPITLVILLLAFGALVAAVVPIVLGLSAVFAALGLVEVISHAWPVDDAVSAVILLIGLAVGVDYSLFYIRRERQERAGGRSARRALEVAAATSGRAVLISGGTVIVAMAGMYLTGNATFISFGTGTIIVVAIAMLGSVSVLPAVLAWLGDRIDKGRVPLVRRLRARRESGFWGWIVERVLRHPIVSALAAGGLLVALAIPAFRLHTVNTGLNGLPTDLSITKTLKRAEAKFPGGPVPAQVVVQAKDVTSPQVAYRISLIEYGALATGLMQEPITTRVNASHTAAVVDVPLAGSGTDSTSDRALAKLRDTVVPNTIGAVPGVRVHVGGFTAQSVDFNDLMKARAPWVFAFVLGLAFCLLMVTFRSLVIPLKAILLNLLSVGAAYGVLVLVFQDGRFQSALGFKSIGGITSWLPLFLFVVLFGLSMDYHVLILTRVREAYDRGMATEHAVAKGIRATAGVVTSAAIVMVAVFSIFATLSALDFKMMGIGLAAAVLIDATIVRAVLLPATMKLLGDWNWYLPHWLDWLPKIEHEPPTPAAPRAAPEAGFAIDVAQSDGQVRVALRGELDHATAPRLGERLQAVEASHPDVLVIDLRGLRFMDSAGLQQLFEASRRSHAAGRRLVLVKQPGPIDHVLSLVRADAAIETVEDPATIA